MLIAKDLTTQVHDSTQSVESLALTGTSPDGRQPGSPRRGRPPVLCNRDVKVSQAWELQWHLFSVDQTYKGRKAGSMDNRRASVNCLARCLAAHEVLSPASVTKPMLKQYLREQTEARGGTGALTLYNDLKVWWKWHTHENDPALADSDCDGGKRCPHLGPMTGIAPPSVKAPKVPVFTQGELAALLRVTSGKDAMSRRNAAIIWVLYQTSIRASELLSLDLGDVDLTTHVITLRAETTKTGEERPVLLGDKSFAAVIRWLTVRPAGDGPLFTSQRGTRLSYAGLHDLLARLGEQAGVADCRAHRFRHTCTHEELEDGMSPLDVATKLGRAPAPEPESDLQGLRREHKATAGTRSKQAAPGWREPRKRQGQQVTRSHDDRGPVHAAGPLSHATGAGTGAGSRISTPRTRPSVPRSTSVVSSIFTVRPNSPSASSRCGRRPRMRSWRKSLFLIVTTRNLSPTTSGK
jgi:site-specific recombinase XerD